MQQKPDEIRVQIPSGKEAVVLDLLLQTASREMYGFRVGPRSDNRLKRGTVYVTWTVWKLKNLVESRLEHEKTNEQSLPRRLYRVTGFGQKAYEAWQFARQASVLQIAGAEVAYDAEGR